VKVKFSAGEFCADALGIKQTLLNLGLEVKLRDDQLTEIIKKKEPFLTV